MFRSLKTHHQEDSGKKQALRNNVFPHVCYTVIPQCRSVNVAVETVLWMGDGLARGVSCKFPSLIFQ
jgi:hypothetical protein